MQQPAVIAAQYLDQILDIEARGFAIYKLLEPSGMTRAIRVIYRCLLQVQHLKLRPDWHLLEQGVGNLTDTLHSGRQGLQTETALLRTSASLGEHVDGPSKCKH